MSTSGPVTPGERVVYWDVLRGFAVLGVLMANMPLMSLSRSLDWEKIDLGHGALDTFAFYFVRVVADTKFITIFSVLFGAGLALMSEKAVERSTPFKRVYARRLAALLAFGVVHGFFVWFGDILFHYAMIGFIAMWLRRLSPWLLLVIALTLLVVNGGIGAVMATMDPADFVDVPEGKTFAEFTAENHQRYRDALSSVDFVAGTAVRIELWRDGLFFLTFWMPRTLALFLVGMALVRSGILLGIAEHRSLARRCVAVGLIVGIPLQALHLVWAAEAAGPAERVAQGATLFWVAIFLSPAYMGLIALWTQGSKLPALRGRLAAVGRMAFTNYIMHSVITGIVFNYLGQYDRWDRFDGLLLTFGIYLFQLVVSPWWLTRWRFGPVEWLWRSITYWRWQPMRREARAPRNS